MNEDGSFLRVNASESAGINESGCSRCNPARSLSHRFLRKTTAGIDLANRTNVSEILSNRCSHFIVSQMRKITSISEKSRFPDCFDTVCRKSLAYLYWRK